MIGPQITVRKSCFNCECEKSESYAIQGDSGCKVYCTHPSIEKRCIGMDDWDTPEWCPVSSSSPNIGNWVNADDVTKLARELDVAMNGEEGAAKTPSLCDVVAQAVPILQQCRQDMSTWYCVQQHHVVEDSFDESVPSSLRVVKNNLNEKWLCLRCKSSIVDQHSVLDDGVTPCSNSQKDLRAILKPTSCEELDSLLKDKYGIGRNTKGEQND